MEDIRNNFLYELPFDFLLINLDGGEVLFVVEDGKNPSQATDREIMFYKHIMFLNQRILTYQKAISEILDQKDEI